MPLRIAVKRATKNSAAEAHILQGHTSKNDSEILGKTQNNTVIEFRGTGFDTIGALISHNTDSGMMLKRALEEICSKMLELGRIQILEKQNETAICASTPTYPPP